MHPINHPENSGKELFLKPPFVFATASFPTLHPTFLLSVANLKLEEERERKKKQLKLLVGC
jgi:hypothetical protein